VDVDPLEIVEFQKNIGVDIGTILDIFGTPDQTKTKASKGVEETVKRAKESMKIKGDMILSCPVQGSIYPDLRTKCAKQLSDLGGDFFQLEELFLLWKNRCIQILYLLSLHLKKDLILVNRFTFLAVAIHLFFHWLLLLDVTCLTVLLMQNMLMMDV